MGRVSSSPFKLYPQMALRSSPGVDMGLARNKWVEKELSQNILVDSGCRCWVLYDSRNPSLSSNGLDWHSLVILFVFFSTIPRAMGCFNINDFFSIFCIFSG